MAMAVDTAPFRLGPIFHFCRAGKFPFLHTILNILFAIGFDNSDQFVARWGSELTTPLVGIVNKHRENVRCFLNIFEGTISFNAKC